MPNVVIRTGSGPMATQIIETRLVSIALDPSLYERPDVLARLGELHVGETLDIAPYCEPNALQILVDALLPGHFLWESDYGPGRTHNVRVTRL